MLGAQGWGMSLLCADDLDSCAVNREVRRLGEGVFVALQPAALIVGIGKHWQLTYVQDISLP